MNVIRETLKPMSISLAVIMFLIGAPVHSVLAAMIGTETVMDSARDQEAREYLHQLLARKDVQDAFIAQGIDPIEARARIDSLDPPSF
jgi:ABC-type microcin C transport system permease subunit YejB